MLHPLITPSLTPRLSLSCQASHSPNPYQVKDPAGPNPNPHPHQVKDRLAETKYQVLNAKEELEQLRAQIVPDPKKLKQELQALQEAVAHEKENVRQVEASGCEASRQLEASERAEREMEAALHGQARTHPAATPPTPHAPL